MENVFVVLDVETNGFDDRKGHILEIGALHIDIRTLEIQHRFQVCRGMREEELNAIPMDDVVKRMHTESGLLMDILISPQRSAYALDFELVKWFKEIGAVEGPCVRLCGNSIHFDRSFLREQTPGAFQFLHHRMIDTSSLLECHKAWCCVEMETPLRHQAAHRAMADCLASLEVMRRMREILRMGLPDDV